MRLLAEQLIPYLAWELSRSEILTWQPGEFVSGAAADHFLAQLGHRVRALQERGEGFKIAIIPTSSLPRPS